MSRRRNFKKKPIVIEAYQFVEGDNTSLNSWLDSFKLDYHYNRDGELVIPTLEGDMRASLNDWIIRGPHGEFYPCKPEIFADTYEEVEGPNDN